MLLFVKFTLTELNNKYQLALYSITIIVMTQIFLIFSFFTREFNEGDSETYLLPQSILHISYLLPKRYIIITYLVFITSVLHITHLVFIT